MEGGPVVDAVAAVVEVEVFLSLLFTLCFIPSLNYIK
jgi:hypothetical protein